SGFGQGRRQARQSGEGRRRERLDAALGNLSFVQINVVYLFLTICFVFDVGAERRFSFCFETANGGRHWPSRPLRRCLPVVCRRCPIRPPRICFTATGGSATSSTTFH